MISIVLKIENLSVYYFTRDIIVRAVNDVSLSIDKGEIMCLIGESGSGKSTLALAIMRLVPSPGRIVNGKIFLNNIDLTKLPEKKVGKIRGSEISMVFQDPMTSLDPLMRMEARLLRCLEFILGWMVKLKNIYYGSL